MARLYPPTTRFALLLIKNSSRPGAETILKFIWAIDEVLAVELKEFLDSDCGLWSATDRVVADVLRHRLLPPVASAVVVLPRGGPEDGEGARALVEDAAIVQIHRKPRMDSARPPVIIAMFKMMSFA